MFLFLRFLSDPSQILSPNPVPEFHYVTFIALLLLFIAGLSRTVPPKGCTLPQTQEWSKLQLMLKFFSLTLLSDFKNTQV